MEESIFTKIIKGEIPCHKVYEDDRVIAFLDIHPINPGHTLVVPKKQIDHIWDLDDDDYHYLWSVTKHLGEHIKSKLDAPRVGLLVDGYGVPHVHVHIVPLYEGLDHTMEKYRQISAKDPDHAALTEVAAKISM
jgi:histidine triad (HIT) family protein